MPHDQARVAVPADTRTRLDVAFPDDAKIKEDVMLKNIGASSIFVGDASVTADDGWEVEPGDPFGITTDAPVHGICAAGLTTTVQVMQVRL